MPWGNEERFKHAKRVWHDTNTRQYRVHASLSKLHYESELDSGNFNTEVNMTPDRVNSTILNGWRVIGNSWHFAYQGFAQTQQQRPMGTLAYGGRKGQHWLTMRPFRMGFLHWPTRDFDAIGGPPTFSPPSVVPTANRIGIDDDDPSIFDVINELNVSLGNLWTAGSGSVEWQIHATGGKLKQDFIINQDARDAIAQYFQNNVTTPATENWFGIAYEVDIADIPNISNDDLPIGSDIEPVDALKLKNATGQILGRFQNGNIYVKNRGGTVNIRKRFYNSGGQWFLFIGARVSEMNQNLLPGDLVIDPPISEESVAANADDADQAVSTMNLNGAGSNNDYLGEFAGYYHAGWIFSSVPIGNGDTITSATLEPRAAAQTGSLSTLAATLAGIDEDDAAAFTTDASNLSGRTDTTATVALASADMPANTARASWDVAAIVAEITVRGGWASNQRLGFTAVTTAGTDQYIGFNDYNGGAANAANFNADVTAASASRGRGSPLASMLSGPLSGPIG